MSLTQTEQAVESLKRQHEAEKELAKVYARVFGSKDGQAVLADLVTQFPHDRARFDALSTKANPVAALIGGVHFDGSAAVTKYIQDRIAAAKAKTETPTIAAP
jgi:Tfp pilus assembly protein PilN